MTIRIALYQPDIPQNTGTILRLGACLQVPIELIEPAGFPATNRAFQRAGMDYIDMATLNRHRSFAAFEDWRKTGEQAGEKTSRMRLVLLTTKASLPYTEFSFHADDILLLGRESAGVPQPVHDDADARICVPMKAGMRSLNIAVATALVVGEALRQTGSFPGSGNRGNSPAQS
jgi:tRNA (cytidine/uridine-2'-O-)-methyltransferase